jgi:PAS domain S-box-containing protein
VERELQRRMTALDLMNEAAVIANEASTLREAIQRTIDASCRRMGWEAGHAYEVVGSHQKRLISTGIWYLSDPQAFAAFKTVSTATELLSGEGLPGRVLAAEAPLWIRDVDLDPNFPRTALVSDLGVKSAVGFPVISGGEVVAVLEFFTSSERDPESYVDEVMMHMAVQLAHVAERESAASVLELSMRQARLVIETANDAFIGIGVDSVITDWNEKATELFGWSRDEALGMRLTDAIIPERYREAHETGLMRFVASGVGPAMFNRIEVEAINRQDQEFPVELTIWPIETPSGYIFNAFLRDITARRQLEAQLNQAQKMEAIGQLAGGVAHDFNNLLAVIRSYAGFVRDAVDKDSSLFPDVEEIIGACDRAAGLTRQLLRLSREDVARPEVLDVNDVVESMQRLLDRTLPASIQVKTDIQDDLWPTKMDRGHLEQVVMNIAVNARDAMPEGGSFSIVTRNVSVADPDDAIHPGLVPGEYVYMSFADTGTGMTEDVRRRIFDPFFTTKEREEGTGLGLATVYGIVKHADGFVFVESQPDRGTVFSFFLPRSIASSSEDAAPDQPIALRDGGEVVLLVEDQEAVRKVVRRILLNNGCVVVEASNPHQALALARDMDDIDLLLTDVVMPQMSGRELALKLAGIHEHFKVLYMSGYTERILAEFGVMTTDESFIQKPFTESALMEAIAGILHGLAAAARAQPG